MEWYLDPIHHAAYYGDIEAIDRLLQEDAGLLNAQFRGRPSVLLTGHDAAECTPLMLAAYRGHDAVVARLLAVGANTNLQSHYGCHATNWACKDNHASTLTLLLDAGTPIKSERRGSWSAFKEAGLYGYTDCVAVLLDRGGDALEIDDSVTYWRSTVLIHATEHGPTQIVRLLLQAGADPTIENWRQHTPLDDAQRLNHQPCIAILEAAVAEPQRPRSLLKARALLDAAHRHRQTLLGNDGDDDNETQQRRTRGAMQRRLVAAASVYLQQRVAQGRELPRVLVGRGDEQLVACIQYALGLEGGGGTMVMERVEAPQGMVKEVFVELCEMLVPKWDRTNV